MRTINPFRPTGIQGAMPMLLQVSVLKPNDTDREFRSPGCGVRTFIHGRQNVFH